MASGEQETDHAMITTSDVGQQGTAESDIEECKAERPTRGVEWVLYHTVTTIHREQGQGH